jgi:stage II sporulation protein AB (anti-sigma F factor)
MASTLSTESVVCSYRALPASVPQARAVVGALAWRNGAGPNDLERIRLVVSEAVTNVVMHAYDERVGNFHLTAAVIAGELTVVVADDGCGLGAARESRGLGLGLGLIAQGCDSLSILARPFGGTQIEMRIALCNRLGPARASAPMTELLSCEGL